METDIQIYALGPIGRHRTSSFPNPSIASSVLSFSLPATLLLLAMEANRVSHEDDEEYLMLDLDCIKDLIDLSPYTPYVLTGLDSMNPVLIIDNKLKLIGHYEETIGTCIVFTEDEQNSSHVKDFGSHLLDAAPVIHEETGPSEANLFTGTCIIDPNQAPSKEVKPITRLHKILKFKLLADDDIRDLTVQLDNSN